ncbi:MAG: extracellular matrix regulator RemB [Oscillospiraceae bacterium]
MFLFIGGEKTIKSSEVVGIFNIEECSVSRITADYLAICQKSGRIENLTYDLPKSFVVTPDKTYISNVSNDTIRKRVK